MSGTADPWEPPVSPALLSRAQHTPSVALSGGPERVATQEPPADWKPPRFLGFTRGSVEREPLLWDGDNA